MLATLYGWIVACGFFMLLFIAMLSPIVITAQFAKQGKNDEIELRVRGLFGLLAYKMKVPVMKWQGDALKVVEERGKAGAGIGSWKHDEEDIDAEKVASGIERFKDVLHLTRNLKVWAKRTLARVKLVEWRWSTSVGTGDAMWTAMATGLVWSVKSSIIGLLSQLVQLKAQPVMSVNPDFARPAFSTEWSCIAKIPFGYAILAGLQLLVRMKKWKGGVKAWQNILFKA
ncbi:DUF2953 domain-containing protein [Paenibacillus sp. J5C_2022]|uniref:DUF2953 domain-containing protein n=1 Tax=Paenibacillus sp. J5C2022 TaxID=2977129 RepID=UPI0021D294A8|nr:DUF2953 domain-containing protein [Paenibacillus sp. J5C2022]MCU6710058.1 DUF2953 domain-containing protein [Paenibacillus sp. J5C2022]